MDLSSILRGNLFSFPPPRPFSFLSFSEITDSTNDNVEADTIPSKSTSSTVGTTLIFNMRLFAALHLPFLSLTIIPRLLQQWCLYGFFFSLPFSAHESKDTYNGSHIKSLGSCITEIHWKHQNTTRQV